MEISQIIPHIEALIFASDKALNANDITELINNAFAYPFNAAAPLTISVNSVVIAACLARL